MREYLISLLHESTTKLYKKTGPETVSTINKEAKKIAVDLKIADRVEALPDKEAFVSLKDHKQNFKNNPQCRLINPAKTEIGLISQQILQRINSEIRQKTGLTQWRKTRAPIDWFEGLVDKQNLVFAQCDIVDFYPSITKKLLNKAIAYASNLSIITKRH